MKIKVLKEENNKAVLEIFEDTHTYVQLLKEYCLKNGAKFVGYYKEHPSSKSILFIIEGKEPLKIIEKSKEDIIKDFTKLKENVEKLKI